MYCAKDATRLRSLDQNGTRVDELPLRWQLNGPRETRGEFSLRTISYAIYMARQSLRVLAFYTVEGCRFFGFSVFLFFVRNRGRPLAELIGANSELRVARGRPITRIFCC